jgi:hypothetical protein
MGVMEEEARRGLLRIEMQRDALRQSELVLQTSIAQQQIDIPLRSRPRANRTD